ncbi:hypothetical protein FBR02_00255 [Anaerolineae bacterium CFX9]|nr:hypothetical protein [Anaerolineae bacterium CFX9]
MRLRIFVVFIGALLIALTYTVPYWVPVVDTALRPDPGAVGQTLLLPGLTAEQMAAFQMLPQEQRDAYLAIAAESPANAAAMVRAAISPSIPSPQNQQDPPALSNPVTVGTGIFQRVDVIRWAQGDVVLYQQGDGSRLMRFDNFSVLPAPDMRVLLSGSADPLVTGYERPAPLGATPTPADSVDDMLGTDADPAGTIPTLDLGPIIGTVGGQNYTIPAAEDLSQYRFVVLYSPSLDMVYGYAPLFLRG